MSGRGVRGTRCGYALTLCGQTLTRARGTYYIQTPSSLTLDTSKLGTFAKLGGGSVYDTSGTQEHPAEAHFNNSRIEIFFGTGTDYAAFTDAAPSGTNARSLYLELLLPIAEWAGSGTVNVGQNDMQFLSHDGTNVTYGADGQLVPNIAVGSATTYDFSFGNVSSDTYILEIWRLGFGWSPAHMLYPRQFAGAKTYGIANYWTSATALRVKFEDGGSQCDGATYASNSATSWASLNALNYKWRLRRIQAGNAVGFGKATPDSSGLVTSFAPTVKSRVKTTSADYTITDTDGYDTILASAASTDVTITLPSASTNAGREITIKKTDAGAGGAATTRRIAISGTIDGSTTNNKILAQYGYCTVISDGTSWFFKTDIQEKGTWTPAGTFNTAGDVANGSAVGRYIRNGRLITFVGLTNVTFSTSTGAFTITGLPYTAQNTSGLFAATATRIEDKILTTANHSGQYTYISPNTAVMTFTHISNATGSNATAIAAADLGSGFDVIIGGSYIID
jgi:hypothetical protein